MATQLETATQAIAVVSFVIGLVVTARQWSLERRAIDRARTQAFLDLRARFHAVLQDMPPDYREPGWDISKPANYKAALRYWQQTFDEWFVTTQQRGKELSEYWTNYYQPAVLRALQKEGLRKALAVYSENGPMAKLWQDFLHEVTAIWAENHPGGPKGCQGLRCTAHAPPGAKIRTAAAQQPTRSAD